MSPRKAAAAGMRVRKPGQRSTPTDADVRALEDRAERVATKTPGRVEESGNHDSEPHEAGPGKGVRWQRKRDGAAMRATTVHLPAEVAAELRVFCARADRRQSDVIADAVRAFLEAHG